MMPYAYFCSAFIVASLSCLALATAKQELLSGAKGGEYGFQPSNNGVSDKTVKRVAIVGKLRCFD